MRKYKFTLLLSLCFITSTAQTVPQRLAQAIKQFESDPQMRHAIASLYVVDAKTGKKIYAHNEQTGLAAASTQKLFTSAAAFELLGKDYRYKTELGYTGDIEKGKLNGDIYILGSCDPTFGSWRWKETGDSLILQKFTSAVMRTGITSSGTPFADIVQVTAAHQAIPDGWIWQDIGNYYGAGAYPINWRENQYDLYLRSGAQVGDSVKVIGAKPEAVKNEIAINELKTAAKGTGDNAYLYFGLGSYNGSMLNGTIPAEEKSFSISGATSDPVFNFLDDFQKRLQRESIQVRRPLGGYRDEIFCNGLSPANMKVIATHLSPTFDSMNYYFLRRSINLYGEAFIKTIALEKNESPDTDQGIEILRDFWSGIGIEKSAIHIIDGSGLSPQNRVTTEAEVSVLKYARTRSWFSSFYLALPEYNGMKMKSGSIGGARAFAGYHRSKEGKEYIFSIIVNNYDGSSTDVVRKMYRVLDVLK